MNQARKGKRSGHLVRGCSSVDEKILMRGASKEKRGGLGVARCGAVWRSADDHPMRLRMIQDVRSRDRHHRGPGHNGWVTVAP